MTAPIALTCGEPAGVGPEIAARAWERLNTELAFFWIGDPRHLPDGTVFCEIATPSEAGRVMADALPVLRHDFAGDAVPGTPDPANAQGVIDVIARAVDLAQSGEASAVCTRAKNISDGASPSGRLARC